MAAEIVYHTTSITNALSPDDFLEQVSLPTIQNIFTQDPFGESFLHFYHMSIWQRKVYEKRNIECVRSCDQSHICIMKQKEEFS